MYCKSVLINKLLYLKKKKKKKNNNNNNNINNNINIDDNDNHHHHHHHHHRHTLQAEFFRSPYVPPEHRATKETCACRISSPSSSSLWRKLSALALP